MWGKVIPKMPTSEVSAFADQEFSVSDVQAPFSKEYLIFFSSHMIGKKIVLFARLCGSGMKVMPNTMSPELHKQALGWAWHAF